MLSSSIKAENHVCTVMSATCSWGFCRQTVNHPDFQPCIGSGITLQQQGSAESWSFLSILLTTDGSTEQMALVMGVCPVMALSRQ